VPDTAISYNPDPTYEPYPGGWLDMNTLANRDAGFALGPYMGKKLRGFTVDGHAP
jgi:hypothetical protein